MEKIVKDLIKEVITSLMDRVIAKVLIHDPFIIEKHRSEKPLYAALVPDEIFKGSHFERRFVTPFGGVWEKLANVVAEAGLGKSELGKSITGTVREGHLNRIAEVLNKLEHSSKKSDERVRPDWSKELTYILAGEGELIPTTVICDLFVESTEGGKKYAFELKAPLPNSDQTKVSKEKIFKLLAMEPKKVDFAYYALPYNPYGKKEDYAWSFPKRWFDMVNDPCVLIGGEFWDFIGGAGTYEQFIKLLSELGKGYHEKIYTEYLGLELPENYEYFSL